MMTLATRHMQTIGPRDRKADCVLRALTFITGAEYTDLEDIAIREQQYKPYVRCGIYTEKLLKEERKLFGVNFQRVIFPITQPVHRVWSFVRDYPHGTFLVKINKHVFAVKDGVIYDACGENKNAIVEAVWYAEKVEERVAVSA
jgi:hypothetical protein